MLKKLRIKFIAIFMTFVTIMLVVVFGMMIFFTDSTMEQESKQLMQKVLDSPLHMEMSGEMRREHWQPYFVVQVGRRGEFFASGGNELDSYGESELLEIVKAAVEEKGESGILKEYDLRYQKANRPNGQMIVFVDIRAEKLMLQNFMKTSIVIGLAAFAAFFGISILLARWAVKPVEQAWQQQRQFVADASHELKTPLTVIMTNAELLQGDQEDENARHRLSESILTMSRQMRGLVEGLLELARVDNGSVQMVFESVNFSQLVSDCLLPFEPLYFENGLSLISELESGVLLHGSPEHLRQVLDILLDNAMKYSEPGGTVRLDLRRTGNHCLLAVSSPGAPLSPEDCRNIFKRFYRVDQARSRDGSYGLGLSIAQSIVQEHRGRIWAESRSGRNIFYVQFPM